MNHQFLTPDQIRCLFSTAMSEMYSKEVPAYATLLKMVKEINTNTLQTNPELKNQLEKTDNLARITDERHGAIRLGKASELNMMRRLFSVMGMYPVSYYDLSVAGIPVHSTAFRPISSQSLSINPFRVFTSLLRLDLVDDAELRIEAAAILAKRDIFTSGVKALIEKFEANSGLTQSEANEFVSEALETFKWHHEATIDKRLYQRFHDTHRLMADVVCFKGPHINHLTPRTLDIDVVQNDMPKNGINPKAVIEGPPKRKHPILLRQTSFKALEEPVNFPDEKGQPQAGTHTARFGEIEQRGMALTVKGRQLYDKLLHQAREDSQQNSSLSYQAALENSFKQFPDDNETLRKEGLAFFEYTINPRASISSTDKQDLEALISQGIIEYSPIIYEDFLPVSAAGIFQSNLGADGGQNFVANANQAAFEQALGSKVFDEFVMYEKAQSDSLEKALNQI